MKDGIKPWFEWIGHRKKNWVRSDKYIKTINNRNWIDEKDFENILKANMHCLMNAMIPTMMKDSAKFDDEIVINKDPVSKPNTLNRLIMSIPGVKIVFLVRNIKDIIISSALMHHTYKTNGGIGIDPFTEGDLIRTQEFIDGEADSILAEDSALKHAERMIGIQKAAEGFYNEGFDIYLLDYNWLYNDPLTEMWYLVNNYLGLSATKDDVRKVIEDTGGFSKKKHIRVIGNMKLDGSPGSLVRCLGDDINSKIDKMLEE